MNTMKLAVVRITCLLLTLLLSGRILAQEGGGADINVDINKDSGGTWYTQPWVWIVGAAVFILLLVALLRGNRASD